MAAVAGRVRLHARKQRVAGKHAGEFRRRHLRIGQADQRGDFACVCEQAWRRDGGGSRSAPHGARGLTAAGRQFALAGEFGDEAVVEAEGMHHSK